MLFNTRNVQSGTFVPFWLAWRSGVELRRDTKAFVSSRDVRTLEGDTVRLALACIEAE
jgi:hypothetical protein